MPHFFLDTNICIYLLKGQYPKLKERMLATSPENIKIPSIVYGELLAGASSSNAQEKSKNAVATLAEQFEIIPFDTYSAKIYGDIRATLLSAGLKGGANDMIIAATAISRGGIVVTNNEKDFARFPGATTENWTL